MFHYFMLALIIKWNKINLRFLFLTELIYCPNCLSCVERTIGKNGPAETVGFYPKQKKKKKLEIQSYISSPLCLVYVTTNNFFFLD